MYKVIHLFTDLQDDNHLYNIGDSFPREGLQVSEGRLQELSSYQNKQGKPLIEKVIEQEEPETIEDIQEEPVEEKPKKKAKKKAEEE